MPLLGKYQLRAIFFVPTSKLNQPGRLTSQMVKEIHKAGHTVGLHSHEHRRLDRLVEEDIRVQIELSQSIIGDLTGALPIIFAPPGGYIDHRVHDVALETGVRVIRTMRWGYNRHPNLTGLECIPLNRHSTEIEFRRILEFRSLALAYAAKQIARKLVPEKFYEPLRSSLARLRYGP